MSGSIGGSSLDHSHSPLVYTTTPVSVFHSQASGGVARTNVHVQLVVDDHLKITSVFTGYPGCTHDACVLKNSALFD